MLRFELDGTQKKVLLYVLAVTVPLLFLSLYILRDGAERQLRKFATLKASRLDGQVVSEIAGYLGDAAAFTEKASWMLRLAPADYKALLPFMKEGLRTHPNLYGSALAIDPDSPVGTTYCRYLYKKAGKIEAKWLMPPAYDYREKPWFTEVKKARKGVWSRPYFDKGGGEVLMSTYSFPLLDRRGRFLGTVTADIRLDSLSEKIQKLTFSDEKFVYLLDENGFLLSHPDPEYALRRTVFDYAKERRSRSLEKALREMIGGKTAEGRDVSIGREEYMMYGNRIAGSGFFLAVFLKKSVLFEPLHDLQRRLGLTLAAGIVLIVLMVLGILREFRAEIARRARLAGELELARKIQKSFLPKKERLEREGWKIEGWLRPAKEVGGDLYGYREDAGGIVFYVGDVSGKGIPAALFMMATQILLENALEERTDPAWILTRVNRRLSEIGSSGMFVTLLVMRYEFSTGALTFCNAGHPPFVLGTQRLRSALYTRHPPVNVFDDVVYTNDRIVPQKPFALVCFSDGVTEAENGKRELFGTERVARTLAESFDPARLRRAITRFVKEAPQSDDITMLALFVHGKNGTGG